MHRLTEETLPALLRRCGLTPLGFVRESGLPTPERVWRITIGDRAPAIRVPLEGDDLAGRVDAAWRRAARRYGILGAGADFLIALSFDLPWMKVSSAPEARLAEHLVGGNGRPGEAEFVTMALDGRVMCGVTTEEYDVWLVVEEHFAADTREPEPPGEVDFSVLSPMRISALFLPDRLRPPISDGWVLLGFHRKASYLERLHEVPDDVIGERPDAQERSAPLTEEAAHAIGARLSVPVDTARLVYFLEYQTAAQKGAQRTKRRFTT